MTARASIDSRTLRPGDIFFALRGERQDGHDHVLGALEAGAASAVVARDRLRQFPAAVLGQLEAVDDPLAELQRRAQAARRAWGGPVVAVTGSAGKTTTKEMIAAALATGMVVHKTSGNFNNHIGLPLTLLALEPAHQVMVVEMGMNHAGEIARLAQIAEPTLGVFTNVGAAHLGNFDSIEGIAAAKRELAYAIPASGALVLNRDDARVARFGEGFSGKILWYSSAGMQLPLGYPGRHNQSNAAAALAVAAYFQLDPAAARAAVCRLEPGAGRGRVIRRGGITLIDDTYNANPEAMEQMLRLLRETSGRRHVAVLGEMRELGTESERLHLQLGRFAAQSRLDALYTVAGHAALILEGAREAGFRGPGEFFASATAAAGPLAALLQPGDVVLCKASRGVHLEDALGFTPDH